MKPESDLRVAERRVRRLPEVGKMWLGVDPATTTGVAVIAWRGPSNPPDVQAWQGPAVESGDAAFHLVGRRADLLMVGVELPFVGANKRSAITHAEASGMSIGGICTSLAVTQADLWRPTPNAWRAMLPGMPVAPRDACRRKELEVATLLGVRPGPRGGKQHDAAAAVCLAWATAWKWMTRR